MKIGNSIVLLAETKDDWSPMHGFFHMYVEDTDATYSRAMDAGGLSMMKPADQYYGDWR